MKLLSSLMVAGVILSSSAYASWNNHALDCRGRTGTVQIHTSEKTNRLHSGHGKGELQANNWELGQVYSYTSHNSIPIPMKKVSEARRSVFTGSKKGFGLYENNQFILDLRDTIDGDLLLKSKITGEVLQCIPIRNVETGCC